MRNKNKNTTIFYELTDFIYYLEDEKHLSANTVSAYKKDLETYLDFLKKYQQIVDVTDIDEKMIVRYISSMKRNNLSTKSISRKITSIKSFHKFLLDERIINKNPAEFIEMPKLNKSLPVVLSVEEIDRMLRSIDTTTPLGKRNKAMLELLYATGLRISELVDLKVEALHMNQKYLEVVGKGNKERIVPIGDIAIIALKDYLEHGRDLIKLQKSSVLFYNRDGNKISRQGFYKYLVKLAKECGITKTISPHTIRHTFATHLLEGGTDLRIVQEFLGHEDISTTQIYTHINHDHLRNIYENTRPKIKEDINEI